MLSLLRLLTAVIGAATIYYVLNGTMKDEMFRIPDLVAGGAMVIAALIPGRIAASAMTTASALALGVFLVALMAYIGPGKPVDLKLVAAMAVNLATILLLHPRGDGHH
jgi:peptidoglycan/LPS O-acetylase OafA/YrhL